MLGDAFGGLFSVIFLALLALQVWALVDCAIRPAPGFPAAGKLTKPIWLAITSAALLLGFLDGPLGLLGLAGLVASIVYLVDVRPAVREITGGGRGWAGGSRGGRW